MTATQRKSIGSLRFSSQKQKTKNKIVFEKQYLARLVVNFVLLHSFTALLDLTDIEQHLDDRTGHKRGGKTMLEKREAAKVYKLILQHEVDSDVLLTQNKICEETKTLLDDFLGRVHVQLQDFIEDSKKFCVICKIFFHVIADHGLGNRCALGNIDHRNVTNERERGANLEKKSK